MIFCDVRSIDFRGHLFAHPAKHFWFHIQNFSDVFQSLNDDVNSYMSFNSHDERRDGLGPDTL